MTGFGGEPVGAPAHAAAVLCAGLAAVWLLTVRDRELRRARLLLGGGGSVPPDEDGLPAVGRKAVREIRRWWRVRLRGRVGAELWCLPAGGAIALLGESWLPLLGAVALLPVVRRWLRRRELSLARDRTAERVVQLCAAVAGELRAGQQPNQALCAAVAEAFGAANGIGKEGASGEAGAFGETGAVVMAAARFGGDVPGALREAARRPGADGLLGVAACWQVAADGGAGLAAGLERVATALRAERDQGEELRSQLAGTRSTAALLALLPVFGLLMGGALGAEPLRVLFHTPAGWTCLAVGGLLEGTGLLWTARIVRSAVGERGSGWTA
ncbi:type II secretion system F family protein [Streptomyces pathocidini]|uniref:type II secretion system F family protein n=1 Tax=Streptomyces pathocidini TaxID=1650571 RepID=UPI0033D9F609